MKVGDLVKHFLTEQIGIVLKINRRPEVTTADVLWTTQGLWLFGPGTKEWCDTRTLEALSASR